MNSDVAMMPGHMIGMITLRNAWMRDAPSIIAASSISLGTSMKKVRNIQMVNGWLIATSAITITRRLSRMPSRWAPKKYGSTNAVRGNARKPRATIRITAPEMPV